MDFWGALIILVIIVLTVGVMLITIKAGNRDRTVLEPLVVEYSSEEALRLITARMLKEGFAVSQRTGKSVTFTRHRSPDWTITTALTILGIVLVGVGLIIVIIYLLYFAIFRPNLSVHVEAAPLDPDRTRLVVSGDNLKARYELSRWLRKELSSIREA
jgi:hypothetical protein